MAKQIVTTTHLTDDIDGTVAERTVAFGFDGVDYEMELSKKNARALEKALEPYIQAARKVKPVRGAIASGRRPRGAGGADRAAKKDELAAIRAWAESNGFEVSTRGRIAQHIVQAYEAAHGS